VPYFNIYVMLLVSTSDANIKLMDSQTIPRA